MASQPPSTPPSSPGYINIPLGRTTWKRRVAQEPDIFLVNRYFETTPTAIEDNVSMLMRPQLKRRTVVGEGPIRAVYQQANVFNDDMFVVSGTSLYRVSKASDGISPDTVTQIGGECRGTGPVYMVAASVTGGTTYLWVVDLFSLQYFAEGMTFANGTLSFSAQAVNGDTFTIGAVTYTFVTSGGTGTSITIGADIPTTLASTLTAIAAESTDVTAAVDPTNANNIIVTATTIGSVGNTIPTTTTGSGGVTFGFIFLLDGRNGDDLVTVPTPDDESPTSIDWLKGFTIVTMGNPFGQRFYYIEPGATQIDPLNFAEAESNLDAVVSVKAIGDQFWLFGTNSTEVWYFTGDPTGITPVAPIQGRPFSRGVWEGTPIKVNDSVILVGQDGRVYDVTAGPNPISYPGIEERIRRAMRIQQFGDFA